jgi:hypothetical protein
MSSKQQLKQAVAAFSQDLRGFHDKISDASRALKRSSDSRQGAGGGRWGSAAARPVRHQLHPPAAPATRWPR